MTDTSNYPRSVGRHCTSTWPFSYKPFIHISTAAVLFADPKDVIVEANQWVHFNCTVHCDYPVRWFMAGHNRAIRSNSSVPGLLIKRKSDSKCSSNQEIHFFEVYATEAWNKSTFYCAAYERHHHERNCSCGKGGRCYSRPALLTGERMFITLLVGTWQAIFQPSKVLTPYLVCWLKDHPVHSINWKDSFLWGSCDQGIKYNNILLCCFWETQLCCLREREELQLW